MDHKRLIQATGRLKDKPLIIDHSDYSRGFRPRKTKRERRAAKNEGWQWRESEKYQVGAIGEETGREAAESAQGSGSAASAQDRPDPELEAMGADFLARSRDFRLEQGVSTGVWLCCLRSGPT
ncbi:UNVERIFIED_CONTAM: hypothetical protein FKN15_022071 [Acipenser sinensis]